MLFTQLQAYSRPVSDHDDRDGGTTWPPTRPRNFALRATTIPYYYVQPAMISFRSAQPRLTRLLESLSKN